MQPERPANDFGQEEDGQKPLDFGTFGDSGHDATWGDRDRAGFALKVLHGIACAYIGTATLYVVMVLCQHEKDAAIFADLMKTVLPSMATLVLGYIINAKSKG